MFFSLLVPPLLKELQEQPAPVAMPAEVHHIYLVVAAFRGGGRDMPLVGMGHAEVVHAAADHIEKDHIEEDHNEVVLQVC